MSATQVNAGIQGLRGVAILLVLLNHAHVPGFVGGYAGVDVFFVISGYLIGGMLLREGQRTGHIDLWEFYARRIRRLFPAFMVVVMAVAIAIFMFRAPMEWAENFSAVRASALYAINIWFTSRAIDYFAGSIDAHPLLHLWSLAVEEQFYLIWPLVVIACLRGGAEKVRRRLGWVTLAVGLLSLGSCIWVTQLNQPLAFFNMPFRMWEFALGTGLVWMRDHQINIAGRLAWLGWAGLAVFTVFVDENRLFPGGWASIPAACTCLMIGAATSGGNTWSRRLLQSSPLVWLGDCSYSLYLWHWPILVFSGQLWPDRGWHVTIAIVAVCLMTGRLSWRYVEEPFRRMRMHAGNPARMVGTVFVLMLGFAAVFTLPRYLKIDSQQQAIFDQVAEKSSARIQGCHADFNATDMPPCNFGAADQRRTVVLWGDSHALNWFPAWEALASAHGWRLISLTKAGCPVLDIEVWNSKLRREYVECKLWRDRMAARILELQPTLLVIANSALYAENVEDWRKGLGSQLDRMENRGIPIAVLRDTPRLSFSAPACVVRAHWRGLDPRSSCSFSARDERVWRNDVAKAQASEVRAHRMAMNLDLSKAFCASSDICPTVDVVEEQIKLRFYDTDHFTPRFIRSMSGFVESRVIEEAKAGRMEQVLELFK